MTTPEQHISNAVDSCTVPHGYCQCGCGRKTVVSPKSASNRGWIKGQPRRYCKGHHMRKQEPEYVVVDCGYETPCWLWQRFVRPDGYGVKTVDQRAYPAHVWYFVQKHGPVPEGLILDHKCRVRSCCNPDHTEPVTYAMNSQRGSNTHLTWDDVHQIRALAGTTSRAELCLRFGLSKQGLSQIITGKRWKEAA